MDILKFLRQFRIGPYAIFDTALSYVAIYLLAPLLTRFAARLHLNISRASWLWLMLPIAVVFHLLFRQNTPFMQQLFHPGSYYVEYIVLFVMLYMGLKHIKSPNRK